MKVVLFCGGLGMRLRDYDENLPKPMVPIGYRPALWHVMKYYAHFGHRDFILCLGYRADVVKNYFRNYDECVSNDFVLSDGGKRLELLRTDIDDWRITFVDTGINSTIGERLKAVERHVAGEAEFLANYSDGLTDLPLPAQLDHFHRHHAVASFVSVPPAISYHFVTARNGGVVTGLQDVTHTGMRINGGYFILRQEIFAALRRGEDLVTDAFHRLLPSGRLVAYRYDGFWQAMDTFKDKQRLDDLYVKGDAPWEVWKRPAVSDGSPLVPPAAPLRLPSVRRRALRAR